MDDGLLINLIVLEALWRGGQEPPALGQALAHLTLTTRPREYFLSSLPGPSIYQLQNLEHVT